MMEFRRIFFEKKMLYFLLFLFGLNLLFVVKEQYDKYELSMGETSIKTIANDYNDLLDKYGEITNKSEDNDNIVSSINKAQESLNIEYKVFKKLNSTYTYIKDYSQTQQNIEDNKDKLSKIGIFNKDNSFSKDNIDKTSSDYEKIADITVKTGNYLAVESLFDFEFTNYIVLLIIITVCWQMLAERKKDYGV